MGGKVLDLEVDRMIERGRQIGLEEGRQEERNARNKSLVMRMLKAGETEDKILLYSGCTPDEVARIRKEMAE